MPPHPDRHSFSVRSFYAAQGTQGPKVVPAIAARGPNCFAAYAKQGGFSALQQMYTAEGDRNKCLHRVFASGLRGCGGSHLPLRQKWLAAMAHRPHTLVVNGMEGEPYTFKDYFLLRYYPQIVLEGIAITCRILGIKEAYLAINSAYEECRAGLEHVLQSEQALFAPFKIHVVTGPATDLYVLGEETALLNYLEGKRGEPRTKPPYPHERGLWGRPTVINNVETLSWLPILLTMPEHFDGDHPKLVTLLGDVAEAGIYEVTLGENLLELLRQAGASDLSFVEVGGISGGLLPAALLDTPYMDEALMPLGVQVGSGTLRAFNTSRNPLQEMREAIDFFAAESCGRCTPCRVGTRELSKFVEGLSGNVERSDDRQWLERVVLTMEQTSTCGLGRAAPAPLLTYLRHFADCRDD